MSFYCFNGEILRRSHKQYPVRLQWNYVLVCKAGPPISWRSIMKGQGLPWLKEILKLPFSSIYLIWFKRTSEEILTAGNPKFWYIFFFAKLKLHFQICMHVLFKLGGMHIIFTNYQASKHAGFFYASISIKNRCLSKNFKRSLLSWFPRDDCKQF